MVKPCTSPRRICACQPRRRTRGRRLHLAPGPGAGDPRLGRATPASRSSCSRTSSTAPAARWTGRSSTRSWSGSAAASRAGSSSTSSTASRARCSARCARSRTRPPRRQLRQCDRAAARLHDHVRARVRPADVRLRRVHPLDAQGLLGGLAARGDRARRPHLAERLPRLLEGQGRPPRAERPGADRRRALPPARTRRDLGRARRVAERRCPQAGRHALDGRSCAAALREAHLPWRGIALRQPGR